MKSLITLIAVFTLTACETTATKEYARINPRLDQAGAEYNNCVNGLNELMKSGGMTKKVNLYNGDYNGGLLLSQDNFPPEDIPVLKKYNEKEFECYSATLQSLKDISPVKYENEIQRYAVVLNNIHHSLDNATNPIPIGLYNKILSEAYTERRTHLDNIVGEVSANLDKMDAAERAKRAQILGAIGAGLAAAGSSTNYNTPTHNASSAIDNDPHGVKGVCFLKDTVKTGMTTQCVYNCIGQTYVQTKSFGMCDMSITR